MTDQPDTAAEWYERICAMVKLYRRGADDNPEQDEAMRQMEEAAQIIEVRSPWHHPADPSLYPAEYRIVLSPHVRIVGELADGRPVTAVMQSLMNQLWRGAFYDVERKAPVLRGFASHFRY